MLAFAQHGVARASMKSEIRDGMKIDWDAPIEMDDGVVLRADVFRPVADGKYPVILSYGPYAKGLSMQEGYKSQWLRIVKAAPDVLEGSSNKHQNWELFDPGEMGAGRLHLRARGFARRRPLAGLSRNMVAARGEGHRRLRRLGRRAALVERQGRPARHLVLFDEPVAGGAAQAEASRGAVHLGGLVGLLPRALPPRRHPLRLLFELVSAPGDRRAARHRRARRQERRHRRAGGGAAEPVRRRAEEEPRRLRRRRAAPPADRRLSQGAAAEVRGHRDAAVLGRQLGRHGAASARQFRGLSARRLEAEMAGGARRHALHAVLCEVRPGPAAAVLRPFPERHRQRLGEAAEGDAATSAIPARNSSPRAENEWPLARTQWTKLYLHSDRELDPRAARGRGDADLRDRRATA